MSKLKKLLQSMIILLLLSIAFNYPAFAEDKTKLQVYQIKYSQLFIDWLNLPEEERSNKEMPNMFDVPFSKENIGFKPIFKSQLDLVLGDIASSTKYYNLKDNINITVKDQGYTGECWAFSTTSILETTYAKLKGQTIQNLSPRHIDYSTTNEYSDGNKTEDAFIRAIGSGGNYLLYAQAYLTNGQGPIYESEMPAVVNKVEEIIPKSKLPKTNPKLRVKDSIDYPTVYKNKVGNTIKYYDSQTDGNEIAESIAIQNRNQMKNHIMTYGALTSTTPGNMNDSSRSGTSFYNKTKKAFYCDELSFLNSREFGGHAITIVGWDDNFSKDNFAIKPVHDGAWIVLNSYGTENNGVRKEATESYGSGYNGYYYISYDDAMIESSVHGITDLSTVDYNNLYQYDALGTAGIGFSVPSGTKAKVEFTKKSTTSEQLNEVGIRTIYDGYVTIYYADTNNTTEVKVSNRQKVHPGFNTVKLTTPKQINTSKYSVIVVYETLNGTGETFIPGESKTQYTQPKIDGNGYVYYSGYYQATAPLNIDLCIKAYTTNLGNANIEPISIGLSKSTLKLEVGKTEKLTYSINPSNANYKKNVTWSSNNSPVASVDDNGVVTAKTTGTATISAITENGKKATCTVTCYVKDVPVTKITLNKESTTIYKGKSESLTATIEPANATNKTLTWTIGNSSIANVTNNGVVIARSNGQTTVTVKANNGVSANCIVYVKDDPSIPTSITPKESAINIYEENERQFSAIVLPSTASQEVTWKSNDQSIASVTDNGLVRGIKPGTTSITIASKVKPTIKLNVPVTVKEKTIISLTMKEEPTKKEYIQNYEKLDLSGGKLLVKYSNETQEEIDMTSNRVEATGFDNKTLGEKTINIKYKEYPSKILSYKVKIIEKEISKIEAGTYPSKRIYVSGVDKLDYSDGTFICKYTDNTEKEVKMTDAKFLSYNLENIDSDLFKETSPQNETENQKFLVLSLQYENRTITVRYSIELKEIKDVKLNKMPNKTVYYINEPLDLKGGELLVTYTDETTQIIKMTDSSCKILDFANINASKEVTVGIQYNKLITFYVEVTDKRSEIISKIEVTKEPNKKEYLKNVDDLNLEGGQIKITHGDGIEEIKNMTDEDVHVTGFNKSILGTKNLTVEYKGTETTFDVNVVDEYEIEDIDITTPTKTTYIMGKDAQLNLEGGKVTIKYKNHVAEDKVLDMSSEEVKVTGFDNKMLGEQTITVEYKEFIKTFTINMIREISKISISKQINKLEYSIGETALDLTGGEILVEYTDGYRDTVLMTDKEVSTSGFNGTSIGIQNITVTYKGFTTEFKIIVSKKVKNVTLKTAPTKQEYIQYQDTDIDIAGGELLVTYDDDSTGVVKLTADNCTISGYDNTKLGEQELTINYRDYKVKYKIRVVSGNQKVVQTIRIKSLPTKRKYILNKENLDLTGGKIEATYNDSSKEEINMLDSRLIVTGFDNSKLGQQNITINYQNKLVSFTVNIIEEGQEITVVSITMESLPTKVNYMLGESLELEGGKIKVTNSDGTTESIPLTDSSVKVTGFNNQKTGTQTLTVTYEGKSCTFNVSVLDGSSGNNGNNSTKTLISIRVSKLPSKTTYIVGEDLDVSGGKIETTYSDSTKEEISMTDSRFSISGYNSEKTGIQMISVRYGNKVTTFSVTVKKDSNESSEGDSDKENSDIRSIAITKMPEKTTYESGEKLDLAGGELTATHTDGTKEKVELTNEKVKVDGFNTFKVGVQSLTVAYEGAETTLAVKVVAKEENEDEKDDKEEKNEKESEENKRKSTVNTGDNIMTYVILLVCSMGVIIISSIKIYKDNKNNLL